MDKSEGTTAPPNARADQDSADSDSHHDFVLGEQAPPIWTKAGIKQRIKSADWLSDIFAQEFGVSDVQANYTRVYAWMANQLGHMTLGLAGALLFIWIAETASSFLELYAYAFSMTGAAAKACQWGNWCWVSNTMLVVTVLGILAAVILAFRSKLRAGEGTPIKPESAGAVDGYVPISATTARWCYVIAPAVIFAVFIGAITRMHIDGALGTTAEQAGLLVATAFIGAAIVFLCKDAEVLAISLPALAIVLIIGTGIWDRNATGVIDLHLLKVALKWEFFAVFALMIVLVTMLYQLRYCDEAYAAMRERGAKKIREYCGLAFFTVFLAIFAVGLQDDWRLALTAAFASTTLWWVKEFGSDIPGVHQEISAARSKRPPLPPGSLPETVNDFKSVELDYMTDARMDARTDGLFYIAGAWIGAGVISGKPVLSDLSWATGAELVGCLVFVAIFLLEGKRWSYRQVALDRMGATRASRLAVFHSAVRMVIIEPSMSLSYRSADTAEALDDYCPAPITALDDFARATEAEPANRIDHIFVFGPLGSGRTPLALAIASEASLASFSTADDSKHSYRMGQERRGRYLRLQRLSHLLTRSARRSELAGYPTQPIWYNADGALVPEGHASKPTKEKAADVVVIDDVDFTGETTRAEACGQLNIAAGQQTVWMFNVRNSANFKDIKTPQELRDWKPNYLDERVEIAYLRDALKEMSKGKSYQRIAVIFVRPYVPAARPSGDSGSGISADRTPDATPDAPSVITTDEMS